MCVAVQMVGDEESRVGPRKGYLGIVDAGSSFAGGFGVELLRDGGLDGGFGHFDEVGTGGHFGDGVHDGIGYGLVKSW